MSIAAKTAVVADESWIKGITGGSWDFIPGASLVPITANENIEREHLRDVELLVLEVDAHVPATLDRLASVKRMQPDMEVIAAVKNADLKVMRSLLRHGVSDVVKLPFEADELIAEICSVGARLAESRDVPLAPTISFVSALGRSGSTCILHHLADTLVHDSDHPIRCCLIDLDLQAGHLAAHAGIDNSRSILSLLEADERLDQDMIRNVATKASDGVYILPAPKQILPLEQVDTDQLLRIVALARAEFDIVLIDMPSAWTTWSLSIAAESQTVLMVTEQTLDHLRQARRYMDLFREVGIPASKVRIVVNRSTRTRARTISTQDVADTLGAEVICEIKEDRGELVQAVDEGKLVTELSRRNVFAQGIEDLADSFADLANESRS
ncbi:hypothetical protein [Erythrobacter alti]|uniref:AAA family ATPase n=1 Tax=Erythrobacter alti TaxID=1896145 RepID=UPI0030F3917E